MIDLTITSASDRKYFWGAFLLVASASRYTPDSRLILGQTDYNETEKQLIRQFKNVELIHLAETNKRNITLRKAEVILRASTPYIAWFDADSMLIGNILEHLDPSNSDFQIRLRGADENSQCWSFTSLSEKERETFPSEVLNSWRRDVGQRQDPLITSTVVANAIILHRRHLDFIREWDQQIKRILPDYNGNVINQTSTDYHYTDESVLTSLLAFSYRAPKISHYSLGQSDRPHLAHFGESPKPWTAWSKRHLIWRKEALDLLDWAVAQGYQLPPVPWSLNRKYSIATYILAYGLDGLTKLKRLVKRLAKNKNTIEAKNYKFNRDLPRELKAASTRRDQNG